MIMAKGDWIWNQSRTIEIRALKSRIKQLEDFIRKNNLKVPRQITSQDIYLGYNMDSEE